MRPSCGWFESGDTSRCLNALVAAMIQLVWRERGRENVPLCVPLAPSLEKTYQMIGRRRQMTSGKHLYLSVRDFD